MAITSVTPRRELLEFLTASPLLAEETLARSDLPDYLSSKPEGALDVIDFHTAAKQRLPPVRTSVTSRGTDGNDGWPIFRNVVSDCVTVSMTSARWARGKS